MKNIKTEQLYTLYKPLLFSLAYRMLGSVMDAEDIVQEAFLTSVVVLEPWSDGTEIQTASETFDAIISIGSFEMIGEERHIALSEMIRVAKTAARIGFAEPMCLPGPIPADIPDSDIKTSFEKCFSTLKWNCDLFSNQGLKLIESYYFEDAFRWWEEYRDQGRISETEQQFITQDNGRWISLGLVVGEKQ